MTGVKTDSCSRCGACCRAGGPALHQADRQLVDKGSISLDELYTIRQGELVRDNVQNRITPVTGDVIKIKSRPGQATCIFFYPVGSLCRIYADRPLECRILKCWDTHEIRECYEKDRLTREALLKDRHDCWNLVAAHQQTCNYGIITELIRRDEREQLDYLVRYDAHIRHLVVEKTGLNTGLLEFLFGLPLSVTIRRYGRDAAIRGL